MKWKKVKLTEICKPKQWKNLPISELTEEGYPVYGANGIIGRYNEYNHEYPTLAITCRGATCGTINITQPKSYITSNAMALNELSDAVDQMFLYYALNKRGFKDVITGAAQPQITREGLSKIILDIPERKEDQLYIANLLSKAENLIVQRKESIRLLDEFLKSTFLEMFGDPVRNEKGWKTKPLNQIVDKLGDGLHGTPVYDDNGEYFFINGNNLEKGFIRTDEKTKRVSYEEYTKHTKELNENTILVSINGTLGRVAFYRGEKIILGKSACYFNLIKGSIDSLFLFHFLQSEFFLKYVTNKATGSTISNVSLKTMRELPIIIPPPILQTQFAQIVEKTEALKTQYQQSLQELENLYGSLSQKAFRGELKMKQNV